MRGEIPGIYKITNKINQKCYIGKSSNIYERWQYHKWYYKTEEKTLYKAFLKYGINNFQFEIIEEIPLDKYEEISNKREKYWIKYYNSLENGYNDTIGGDGGYNIFALNKTRKLTENEVINIRELYAKCEVCLSDAYELYKDKISKRGFQAVWLGQNYKKIKPEIFTEENKKKHILIEHQR